MPSTRAQLRAIDGGRQAAAAPRPAPDPAPPLPEPLPYLLTADDMAALIRTTRKTIYNLAEQGALPGVTRVGGRLRFSRDVVLRWLEKLRTGPTTPGAR